MEGKSKQGSSRHPDLPIILLIFLHKAGRAAEITALGQAHPCPGTALHSAQWLCTRRQDSAFLRPFPCDKAAYQHHTVGQPQSTLVTHSRRVRGDPASELVKKEGVSTTTEGKKGVGVAWKHRECDGDATEAPSVNECRQWEQGVVVPCQSRLFPRCGCGSGPRALLSLPFHPSPPPAEAELSLAGHTPPHRPALPSAPSHTSASTKDF